MKRILLLFLIISSQLSTFATGTDEGMWLPLLLKKYNYEQMKKMGLKLTAEQLYDVNHSGLKDAVVSLGGFCTGELVSKEALMLTNHHCGYDAIASHSSKDNDLLSNGFWAMNRKLELQNPGLYADILVRMEEVTAKITAATADLKGEERGMAYATAVKEITAKAVEGTHYKASVVSMFRGNEYYLIVFERFTDVRLVGAPPSSIGKFGGDKDNWMWPRHTGDFSVFRIYAGKDNKPADYSPDNVPFTPRHVLPVSLKGIGENDFTIVTGYPATTNRYLTSFALQTSLEQTNPAIIDLLGKQLEVMKKYMDADDAVRIKLASDYASLANTWKYFLGQNEGLKKSAIIQEKKNIEKRFNKWLKQSKNDVVAGEYMNTLSNIDKAYKEYRKINVEAIYASQLQYSTTVGSVADELHPLADLLKEKTSDKKEIEKLCAELKESFKEVYKDAEMSIDQHMLTAMLSLYALKITPEKQLPVVLDIITKYAGGKAVLPFDEFTEKAFPKSILASEKKLNAFLNKPSYKKLMNDPLFSFFHKLEEQRDIYREGSVAFSNVLAKENKLLIKGLREMDTARNFYPDANSTLRLSFGKVSRYQPKDAVVYDYFTTMKGIMDKDDAKDVDFKVPEKLKQLYAKKDFGQYAVNGDIPVAFITDNDITGGNSGSPVINGNGELVGIAFDGNWEGMTSDLMYDAQLQRCINVDIRYVLFVIEKYAGAGHLINEMTIVK
jgi:hypothetical protein